jgi:hypothetical protein
MYRVVVFQYEGEEIEVEARDYGSPVAPGLCIACNRPLPVDQTKAAKRDGQEFGEMLTRRGARTFRQALLEVLLADKSLTHCD